MQDLLEKEALIDAKKLSSFYPTQFHLKKGKRDSRHFKDAREEMSAEIDSAICSPRATGKKFSDSRDSVRDDLEGRASLLAAEKIEGFGRRGLRAPNHFVGDENESQMRDFASRVLTQFQILK